MFDPNNTPTFNLKVVVRETGLKPDTLRAWERRYGIPQPQRTSGAIVSTRSGISIRSSGSSPVRTKD